MPAKKKTAKKSPTLFEVASATVNAVADTAKSILHLDTPKKKAAPKSPASKAKAKVKAKAVPVKKAAAKAKTAVKKSAGKVAKKAALKKVAPRKPAAKKRK